MSCNCIQEVREAILESNQDYVSVTFGCYPISNLRDKNAQQKTGQPIEVGYMHNKKDGTKVKKYNKTFITHQFCPFCGVSYEPAEETTDSESKSN